MRASNYERLLERKKLEESWDAGIRERYQQLKSERRHNKEPGILLHDQCERYKRYVVVQCVIIIQWCRTHQNSPVNSQEQFSWRHNCITVRTIEIQHSQVLCLSFSSSANWSCEAV